MDSLDEKIIRLLEKDARASSETLSHKLNTSPATVRRRIKNLVGTGVLRLVALIDPHKANLPIVCGIRLNVDHGKLEMAASRLASYSEVKWIATVTGPFEIFVTAAFRSTTEMSDFVQDKLAKIEGLRGTETFICLNVRKGRYIRL
jgi:Lrp/AsnC family transcriptional regulator for asnA, asnC and gidA